MAFFADIKKMSDNGLKAMQRALLDRLNEEDSLPTGQEKIYGVREFSDWREQGDEMEAELDRRQIKFEKIPW